MFLEIRTGINLVVYLVIKDDIHHIMFYELVQ